MIKCLRPPAMGDVEPIHSTPSLEPTTPSSQTF